MHVCPDAWLFNSTQKIYSQQWRDEDRLWDSESPKFKELENSFCAEVGFSSFLFYLHVYKFEVCILFVNLFSINAVVLMLTHCDWDVEFDTKSACFHIVFKNMSQP